MRVVGLDFALTTTGFANLYADEGGPASCNAYRIKSGARKGHERVNFLLDRIIADAYGADLLVMEGISFNSFDAGKQLAGAWWIVKHRLWEERVPTAVVQPASLKLYATGHGDAKKSAIHAAVNGPDFPLAWAPDHDSADAAVLAHMGARYLGEPVDQVGFEQQAAILRAEWPGRQEETA